MPEWLIEEGIGETRLLLVEDDEVLKARLHWPGEMVTGDIHNAQLTNKIGGTRRGVTTLDNGIEALIDHLPTEVTEGARGTVRITRAPIAERGRLKRAQGRWLNTTGSNLDPVTLKGEKIRRFGNELWEEVWHAASSGSIAFRGGEILCSVTPAMTVIDVDGDGSPRELALAAIPAISNALRWFDLAGNIGIDFPTIASKVDRKAVDEALENALASWPHERTAMNGFGFVQLVAQLESPSLLQRFATSRTGMCARYALRVAERAEGAGPVLLLTVHPALKAKLKSEWLDELTRRSGKQVRIKTDPGLALEAPQAQIVER